MKDLRDVLLGILAAILSAVLLLGSLSLALLEGNMHRAPAASSTVIASPTQPMPELTLSLSQTVTASQPWTSTPALTLTPTPTSSCSFPTGWLVIEVLPGDTLDSLAATYNTTPEELIAGNCLLTRTLISNTFIYVPALAPTETVVQCGPPAGWVLYTVRAGDNLYSLAEYFGVTWPELQLANCLTGTLIYAGNTLYVPNIPTPTYALPPTNPPTRTSTPTPTLTLAPIDTPTPITPTPTFTWTPGDTVTPTDTETATPTPTDTETPTPTPEETQVVPTTETPTPIPYPAPYPNLGSSGCDTVNVVGAPFVESVLYDLQSMIDIKGTWQAF